VAWGKSIPNGKKHANTAELRLGQGEGKERDCIWGREATKRLNETRTFQNVTNSIDNCSL